MLLCCRTPSVYAIRLPFGLRCMPSLIHRTIAGRRPMLNRSGSETLQQMCKSCRTAYKPVMCDVCAVRRVRAGDKASPRHRHRPRDHRHNPTPSPMHAHMSPPALTTRHLTLTLTHYSLH
eukprot:scaffold21592_cov125-Isochrysis_galbana.AAC.7